MNFEEFKNRFFNGDEAGAIKTLAKERHEFEYTLTKTYPEWKNIYDSLDEKLMEKYEEYRKTLKWEINSKTIISSMNEYKTQRNVFSICIGVAVVLWFGLMKASGMFNLIFFLLTSLCAICAFSVWVVRNNKVLNALIKGDFYIVKSECSYKNIKTESVDWSDVDSFSVYFPGYEEFKVRKHEYDSVRYGEEYFLVIINGIERIQNIYSSEIWELSEEFYERDGKYYLKFN